eukprot:2980317-Prymnesium_polylepis.1
MRTESGVRSRAVLRSRLSILLASGVGAAAMGTAAQPSTLDDTGSAGAPGPRAAAKRKTQRARSDTTSLKAEAEL